MELKLPYVKDYELDDDFLDALDKVPQTLSLTIALYLEEYLPDLPSNYLCSHIKTGLVFHYGEPVPFVIEVLKSDNYLMVLSDLQFIDMDEYLDLTNLKLNLEIDERFSYPKLALNSK